MGHGSSPTQVKQIEPGVFEVSQGHFIMGGDWEIRFEFLNNKVVLDQATYNLEL